MDCRDTYEGLPATVREALLVAHREAVTHGVDLEAALEAVMWVHGNTVLPDGQWRLVPQS